MVQKLLRRLRFGQPIVVVSGLPRSGTSMMMKMLEAGGMEIATDHARKADEDNPKGYYELERVKKLDKTGDKSWLKEIRGKAVKIISFLLRDLPDDNAYRILFMKRNLEEIMASQNKMLTRRSETGGEASEEKMIQNYKDHVRRVRSMLMTKPNMEWIEVDYRRAIEAPGEVAAEVNAFLGGELEVAKIAEVADANLYRNRK